MGFALVFTSTPLTDNLIGGKLSGLSYEGLMNGIAIEFDFIQNIDSKDSKDPHISIHYNLNGPIPANSPADCKLCNIKLPNFYVNFQHYNFRIQTNRII